ncbi:MAG: glucosamine-6-phosphate deaminase [Ruminococcaceae bacterium]|nr:glucosamine-6-phosphate deaminase [Oscillospiraceae bacterium]
MKIIVCKDYDEMSVEAAKIVAAQMKEKKDSILGLATGSTPLGLYNELVKMNQCGEIDFSEIKTFNLDEYYPISHKDDQSYYYFMNENLFSRVNIDPANTDIPNGEAPDAEAECKRYDAAIDASAGVDIQILGIGQNGHIAFNEASDVLHANTHQETLTENTIQANSRFFENEADVPRHALTMGVGSIMKARKIILLASGKNKRDAVRALTDDTITTQNPATLLKLHKDVIIICDEEAMG